MNERNIMLLKYEWDQSNFIVNQYVYRFLWIRANKHIDQHRHGIQTLKWFDGFSLSVVMVTSNENLNILQYFFFLEYNYINKFDNCKCKTKLGQFLIFPPI